MTTDAFKQKLIVSGGVAIEDDVNNSQRFLGARLYDQFIARHAAIFDQTDLFLTTAAPLTGPYAYALHGGSAYLKQGASGNAFVGVGAGTLFQKTAADTGTEETMLAFTFAGTEQFTAIAAGDPSNPRVDLLQMKLELVNGDSVNIAYDVGTPPTVTIVSSPQNTTRRVQCTLSVKQGTPAASPTVPTLDAGYVALGMVVVGTSYAAAAALKYEDAAGAVAVLHDLRMPINGLRAVHVHPRDFVYLAANVNFPLGQTFLTMTAADNVAVYCPHAGQVGRLLGVASVLKDPSAQNTHLGKFMLSDAGGEQFFVANGGNMNGSGTGQLARRQTRMHGQNQNIHTPAAGPTVTANAAGIGPPLWTNGKRCPMAETPGPFPNPFEALGFQWASLSNTSVLGPFTFYIAE